ncbi:hypothetical protein [Allochromatium vinosum]|uniref:hypothetical protein n=1 Tax=Allochromatium vinosum TaxID=1049 RepID=UPI001907BE09|nr:hypothetical protein [Allochromatium vinosum]
MAEQKTQQPYTLFSYFKDDKEVYVAVWVDYSVFPPRIVARSLDQKSGGVLLVIISMAMFATSVRSLCAVPVQDWVSTVVTKLKQEDSWRMLHNIFSSDKEHVITYEELI